MTRLPILPAKPWAAALGVALLAAAGAAHAVLPAPVARALRAAGVAPDQVALHVEPIDASSVGMQPATPAAGTPAAVRPFATHRARVPMNPASTMKVLTTYAALSLLGADYRWRTEWLAAGRLRGDTLEGDLVLRGGGDPRLVIEDLAEQVARLRASGLRRITGDLVLDDSLWAMPREPFAFDGEGAQPYNVVPNAAMLNFKAVRVIADPIEVAPAAPGFAVRLEPALADVALDNAIEPQPGPCRPPPGALAVVDAGDDRAPAAIRVGGRLAPACGEQSTMAAVLTHRQFAQALFAAAWRAAGGEWSGSARWGATPEPAVPLLAWASPHSLADVVRDVNKFSNNVMARSLLLQIAARARAVPATPAQGAAAVQRWLRDTGLRMPELVVDNGAGLSRSERIAAASMVAMLRHAAVGPQERTLRESLPVAGVDGTMARRLVTDAVAGNAWIKTGRLADVRAVAGYVQARSGRRYALSMMVNAPRADATVPAIDELLRWLYARG